MRSLCAVLVGSSLLAASSAFAGDVGWQRVKIDEVFRSEGVAAADVNKDGKMDVIHGQAWYEAPNWTMHPIGELKDYKDGSAGYSDSFADWAYDVNGDGWLDLICVGFPGKECHWFENPRNKDVAWKKYEIWHSAANETPLFTDLTGDGRPELIMASETEGIVGYLELPATDKVHEKWAFTTISDDQLPKKFTHRYYHGLGTGDVNKDGRIDVVIPHGWWEAPQSAGKGPWTFHPLTLAPEGKTESPPAANIYVDDLDLDGDQDVLMSSAHQVGVWWFENVGTNAEPKHQYHLIYDIVTQTHALEFADINGDGVKDLVTGKRWWAHGPKGDINPNDDPVMVWIEIKKSKGEPPRFTPHVIAESSGSGMGTQFQVVDFNGDGQLDILTSNKRGTNLLLQRRAVAGN